MPSYPPQQQPPYGGAPAGGYGGAPGHPGAPGGYGGAPGYPSAPGGLGGAPGYPGAPGGGNPGYPGNNQYFEINRPQMIKTFIVLLP